MSIVEVAKAAGVSTATVSRVLNDLPGVRMETVRQVRAAADALNYTRLRARRKSSDPSTGGAGRTGKIAVVTLGQGRDWLQLPVLSSVVAGIRRAAGEFELQLLLEDLPDLTKPSPLIKKRQIDGAIVFVSGIGSPEAYETALASLREYVPVVWAMGLGVTVEGVDHVAPDNIRIGYLAHRYLVSQGCDRLAFVTAEATYPFMRLRGQSFLNAAADAGRPASAFLAGAMPGAVAESYGRRVVTSESLEGLVAALAAMPAGERPTGLFVANDLTTVRLYPLLARHGLRVGQDLTLVSCDNEDVRLSALDPRPASIDIGAEEIGFRSVIRLRARRERTDDLPLAIQVLPTLRIPGDGAPR